MEAVSIIARPGFMLGRARRTTQSPHKLGPVLHAEVLSALKQLQQKHPEIKKVLSESVGYAVVPEIGRASLVLGGAYGLGEVFVHDQVIGYAAIVELTIGVQVSGTTFHELVVFHDEGSLKTFKSGKFALAAGAAVELVKAGAPGVSWLRRQLVDLRVRRRRDAARSRHRRAEVQLQASRARQDEDGGGQRPGHHPG
jgi:hypothetical protein